MRTVRVVEPATKSDGSPARVSIRSEADVVLARHAGREAAASIGFAGVDLTVIVTAISELARNIVVYAGSGEVVVATVRSGGRRGIEVVARDEGPGIQDVALAMQDGYSTGKGLGLGLPGTRRLMDEFAIDSAPGRGTRVTVRKWLNGPG